LTRIVGKKLAALAAPRPTRRPVGPSRLYGWRGPTTKLPREHELGHALLQPSATAPTDPGDNWLPAAWARVLRAFKVKLNWHSGADTPRLATRRMQPLPRLPAAAHAWVEAAEVLRTELVSERKRNHTLNQQVARLSDELAQARVDLAGTQACERRANHMALHDGLTALPNRRHFMERLQHVLTLNDSPDCRPWIVYLDLDGFKEINDLHGHQTGDNVLKVVAGRMLGAVRRNDLMARLGGDEFVCLLKGNLSTEQLVLLAEKLYCTISEPISLGSLRLSICPSIGLAQATACGTSADALLAAADAAMYQAKQAHTRLAFAPTPAAST
jgi:diguanylate cyclase (GGDEF)-like protein